MVEDKQQICDLMTKALQATESGADLVEIRYRKGKGCDNTEYATLVFKNGGQKELVVTFCDGIALIKCIARWFF